ncbi:MAG: hypothetical protein M9898_07155 [Chitinophagaceae bacterium]|nr:hypothetical protein [Chitinophagaceae bacterium]
MKRLSIILMLGLCSALFIPDQAVAQKNPVASQKKPAVAQKNPVIAFEYMQVKPGNTKEYMQVENFWRDIHIAQLKNGNILDWFVWEVVAPYRMDNPYQYVVITVYPEFSDLLHPYKGIDLPKVFSKIPKDSVDKMLTLTGESRDMVQQDIFFTGDPIGTLHPDSINYMLVSFLKITPEKSKGYGSFIQGHWLPLVRKVVKDGYADIYWQGSATFSNDNSAYNSIMAICWKNDSMYDTRPPFEKYEKEDPIAFEGYKWYTEIHNTLLRKVVSLSAPAK